MAHYLIAGGIALIGILMMFGVAVAEYDATRAQREYKKWLESLDKDES